MEEQLKKIKQKMIAVDPKTKDIFDQSMKEENYKSRNKYIQYLLKKNDGNL